MSKMTTNNRASLAEFSCAAKAEVFASLSNAELLAKAERENSLLARELAARYGAALGLLHRADLRFTSLG